MKKILILFVHPNLEKSQINRPLLEAVSGLPNITVHDLYQAYPDFRIDVQREQALLAEHDILVIQHPIRWYSSPALLKEWLDEVLAYGFAYGPQGNALKGKACLHAVTAGGGSQAYKADGSNRYTLEQFLAPFEQTALFCGMDYLQPFVIYNTPSITLPEEIEAIAQRYQTLITGLRDGTVIRNSVIE